MGVEGIASSGRTGAFHDYAGLGIQHILTGWDHLLFVLGLVFLIGWGSSFLWTVTAFTLRRLPIAWPKIATAVPAYGIGSLVAYWFFERVAGLW